MNMKIEVVDVGSIKPDPNQPRKQESIIEEEIDALAQTYGIQGMIHTIEIDENDVIILGERRWLAAKKIGLKEVRIIRKLGLDKQTRLERQLIDDANRKDLNDMERAWAYTTAIININLKAQGEDKQYTIPEVKEMEKVLLVNLLGKGSTKGSSKTGFGSSELARRLFGEYVDKFGKKQPRRQKTINNLIRLLNLPEIMRKQVEEKKVNYTTALEAEKLEDKEIKEKLYKTLLEDAQRDVSERTFKSHKEVRKVVSFINEPAKKIVEKDVLDVFTRSDLEGSEREEAQERIKKVVTPKVKLTKGEKNDLVAGLKKLEKIILKKKEKLIADAVTDLIEQVPEDVLTEKEQEMREHAAKSRKEREESNKRLRASALARLKRKFYYSTGAHGAAISGIDEMFCPKCGKDSSNLRWTCCDITLPEAVKLHELVFGKLQELSDDEYKDSSEQEIRDKIKIGVDK